MYKNYGTINTLMDGAELLYTMIKELNDGIRHLPGCRATAKLKQMSDHIDLASIGVYHAMQNIALNDEPICDEADTDAEEYDEDDIPTGDDLQELLDKIAYILASGKPVSISADIYINEDNVNAEDAE